MRRQELSDAEWDLLRPLPPTAATGRPRLDDRMVLNGIVWKFRTRVAWRNVPERYGSWATLHTRFRRWAKDGTFERMLHAAQAKADSAGDIDRVASVDSTIDRAHQHAAGARKRGLRDQSLGRSRGGLTSKLHLAVDGLGRPLGLVLTGGNVNDCTQFTALMDAIRVPRSGPGRPRTRPAHVIGDKGYSPKAIRAWLRQHNIAHTIPKRVDQIASRLRRSRSGRRPPAFDKQIYKRRNVVEPRFNRLKQWRGIATRYDKTAECYQAAVALVSLLMWA
ncbi:IS5 family transposase [Streptomyces shenzhenensis]|uniref:IS5/IS1182 family transposase n=1 Tax=Streptomyces shenzhenensis TaxID=943815 RepID=A0A3M0HZ30_9ACTN|nr:IS5 family transposase [Streptomyces shenzhenensis]RMB81458.1 IS5/IS1182 family transposase [Streptomyces shenzhenensis]